MSELQDVLDEVKGLDEKIGGIGNMVQQYRETVDKEHEEVKRLGEASADTKAKLAKFEADFEAVDKLSDRLTLIEEARKAADEERKEAQEQIDRIEVALKRSSKANEENGASEEIKLFNEFLRKGPDGLEGEDRAAFVKMQRDFKGLASPEETKALSLGDSTQAGVLAPPEYAREIIKAEIEFSPFRPLARVRTTGQRSVQIPKRTGVFAAVWTAERGTRSETEGLTYALEEIPTHELYALVDINQQMLEDSLFNLEAELNAEFSEQFAVAEGNAFVTGNAAAKPEGFLDNTDVLSTNSGSAATIADTNGQADGIVDLYHDIKTAYAVRGTFVLNRSTLGSVRKLKDAENNYIWMAGISGLRPNTILDAPYVEVPDMPDEAANAFPIAFGDWRRAYTIVDRIVMSVLRDPFTQATSGNVRFIARKRVGGQVVLSEAIRLLKCST